MAKMMHGWSMLTPSIYLPTLVTEELIKYLGMCCGNYSVSDPALPTYKFMTIGGLLDRQQAQSCGIPFR